MIISKLDISYKLQWLLLLIDFHPDQRHVERYQTIS